MVVGWRSFVFGGVASCIAELGTFPIDVAKSRLQVQGQKIDTKYSSLKYNGFLDVLRKVSAEEGPRALYHGLSPALLRQAVYGSMKFGIYYELKKILMKDEENFAVNVFCSAFGGAIASGIANPTDVLKVRMQIQGKQINKSLLPAFADIFKNEGVRGLYRGVIPTMQRAALIAAVELPVYDFCKYNLLPILGNSTSNHLFSSAVAGFSAAVACTPVDVLRTRIMNQRRLRKLNQIQGHLYKGVIDCFIISVRNEGIMTLYKGFVPTVLRIGPWNIVFFIVFEKLKNM